MKQLISLLVPLALTGACVDEPSPKQAEKAAETIKEDDVKMRQQSIEQAAEEATKLIEADAKAEIDALASESLKE